MKCEKCGKYLANVVFESNINGKVNKQYLCSNCANNIEMEEFNRTIKNLFDFDFINFNSLKKPEDELCPICGNTYYNFINKSQIGCPNCYDTFLYEIRELLENTKTKNRYINKDTINNTSTNNSKTVCKEKNLEELKNELDLAIKEERYEDAAIIRDEIKEIDKKI